MTKSRYSEEQGSTLRHPAFRTATGATRFLQVTTLALTLTMALGLEFTFTTPRAAAAQTVMGETRFPDNRSVINFLGLAAMEQQMKTTAHVRSVRPPLPLPVVRVTNNPAGRGGGGAGGGAAPASPAPGVFQPAAVGPGVSPPPSASFGALLDDLTVIPPDTMGTVGPNHVMTTLNSQVRIQDRNGNVISTVSFNTFWQSVGAPVAFDPVIRYDPFARRWIFSAGGDGETPRSSVLLAVSQTSDPTGNWYLFRVDADRNNLTWADYPQTGFNKDWIVITVNMFPIFNGLGLDYTGVNLYVFNKTNVYAGGTAQFTLLKDISTIGFTMVPAVTYDDTLPVMNLVEVDALIQNFTTTSRRLRLSTITGPVGSESLNLGTAFTTDTNIWASSEPAFSAFFFGGFAPQLGSFQLVENGDSRIINAVYRNGSLWCSHHVFLPASAPNHTAVQWWQLATNGTAVQFGRIEDPSGNIFYAYPSIAVNRNGDALMGFSRFSANQFPSADYAFRSCSDPQNIFRTEVVLKDGEAPYEKLFQFGDNRWGDYSSTVVDPVNDLDFWTLQEYAASPTNQFGFPTGRWGTWWGKVAPVDTCLNIEFVSSEYDVNEGTPGYATINLLNIGGAAGTVDWFATDGTAIFGTDYEIKSGTVSFAAGQLETNFIVRIFDNAEINSNKFFTLTLANPSGPATLGRITNAIVVIQDDETLSQNGGAGEINFSSYVNGGIFYTVSEYESQIGPYDCSAGAPYVTVLADGNIGGGPERNALGALITVVRTNGANGRILVDFQTAEGGTAIPFVDYTPVSGTLAFDDYQMSTNFLVEVFPEPFFGFNTFSNNLFGLRFIRVVLSNARPAPEEEAARPGAIRPTLGLGKESLIQVHGVNVLTNGMMFERRNWRFDEYADRNPNEPYRVLNVQVLNPSGTPTEVWLRTRQAYQPQSTPNNPPRFPPGNWIDTSVSPGFVQAGSDLAEAAFPGAWQGITVWTPNQVITDPALTTITNYSDYLATNVSLTFAMNECRKNIELIITNDTTVEFNEDIWLELIWPGVPNNPVHPFGWWADVTILYDDQPAGALDREWNRYNLASSDPPFNRTPGTDGLVRSLAVQPDNKTVLGGDFIHVNAVKSPGLARMNTNGAFDATFIVGDGVDGFVSSVVLYPSTSASAGRILIGGEFNSYNSQESRRIARLLPNGVLDPSFRPGSGANGTIWSIALQSDEKILVAGSFTEFNDLAFSGVVRLNPDGSVDGTFNVGAGAAGTVWAVGVSSVPGAGDQAVLGGDFLFFNNEFHSGILRLNPDGSNDPSFETGGGVNGPVFALAVQPDNKVIIGGSFGEINARIRINIARFNTDGSLDSAFNGGFGPDAPILAITLQPDGKALIGGPFSEYNRTRRMGLARLRLNGTLDTSFLDSAYNQFAGLPRTFSFEPPNYATALAVQPDGKVMIGGSFTNIGGNPSIQSPKRNDYTVFTRADKQIRFNIARVLGGATPGPGNAEFDTESYYVNENADVAAIQLQRTDGRLGTMTAIAEASDRVAISGLDYLATNKFNLWPEGAVGWSNNFGIGPMNVGQVSPSYFRISIINDDLQEGDETVGLNFVRPEGSLNLSGEFIPLGAALGRAEAVLNIADDDVNHGIFNFATYNFVTNENAGTALITVIRTNGSQGLVSVQVFTRNTGPSPLATPNVDYRPTGLQTLIFPSGVTSQTFRITLIDDNLVEFDENIEMVLTNATGGAKLTGGTPTSITTGILTIIDNDFPPGRLNFSASTITTNEDAGFATVTVNRTGGSVGAVSVQYATSDGTATAPADYAATTGTLSWNDGDSSARSFTVPLVADGIVDGPPSETINLRLFNPLTGTVPTPGLLGGRTNATIVLLEADAYGVLSFNQSFYEADENAGSAIITVVRRNGLAGNVSVNYSVTPNDPQSPGKDYVATGGTLNFGPGESSKSFTITLLDDTEADGNKTLVLALSGASNATLGSPNPVTLTLIDNESFNIPAGELDTSFRDDTQTDGPIYTLALQPDGRLLVAGEFSEVDNITRSRIARLRTDGALDASFDPGVGANNTVRAMVLQPDGKFLIGGFFTTYNGTNRGGMARINPDGTVDSFFVTGSGANNPVYALALQPDDKVLVGGSFSSFNGFIRPALVRLNTNGVVDVAFSAGAGPNNTVYAIAIQSDGKILIGGEFTAVNGQARSHLARLNRNGSLDLSFDAGPINGPVRSILVQPDGGIVVGGSFSVAGGAALNNLARFNSDGTLDGAFMAFPATGGDGPVFVVVQQVDGKLLVAGDFRTFNGVTRNRLTRLNSDGTTDPTINFGNGANSFVAALAIQPDRKIFLAGGFTTYDDHPRQHLARIHGGAIAGGGALEFSQPEFLVQENVTNALITIRRRFGTTGAVSVNYRTIDGTAVAGTHYQFTAGTATFSSGETRFNFLVPIIDNGTTNEDLTVGLQLIDSTFTGGATNGPQPISVLRILDDEIAIGFATANYDVGENTPSGLAPIQVRRHGGTNGTAFVQFSTSDGSATAGSDYIATNGVLTFLPGEISKTFQIRILNDTLVEGNETVFLTLGNPSPSVFLGIANATLLIRDDDFAAGQFLFRPSVYSVTEDAGFVVLTIVRTNGSSGVVSVQLNTVNNTAIAGQDFGGTNIVLAFLDGEVSKDIAIPIIDDVLVEPTESFNVVLSNPGGGATLGAQSSAAITILDDDVSLIVPAGSRLIAESLNSNNIIDPNEVVTLGLGLRNIGSGDTVNLVATLLVGNGVTQPNPVQQTYGVLPANGGRVEQNFSFKAVGNVGDRLIVTLLLTDNGPTNGSATFAFTLGGQATRTFTSTNRVPILINDNTVASEYPTIIPVANMGGTITKLTVTLTNLSHAYPDDIDILLVSPTGEKVMLMSDAGSSPASFNPINNVTLTFDSAAATVLPDSTQITSGTYRPANYASPLGTSDSFPLPAPPLPYTNVDLTVLNGLVPNGNWSLFIVDDTPLGAGSLGGWSLNIQTSDPVAPAPSFGMADVGVHASSPGPVVLGANLSYTFTVTNTGPATASNVGLLSQMPAGLTFVSASSSAGTWKKIGTTLNWSVGSLAPNASAKLTVNSTANAVGTWGSTASVAATQQDPNMTDNAASAVTTVVGAPLLTIGRVNNTLRLSWPVQSGFRLQLSDGLRPAHWTDFLGTYQVQDGQNVATVVITGTPKFFRLYSP